jgi:hypothetical protein
MKPLSTLVRRWPNAEAKEWAEAFVSEACAHPSVLAVVAFGAAVRTALFTADIDLLVLYERPKPQVKGRPIDVDIRWYERNQTERFIREGQELLGWVLRHGELVCEKNAYWTDLRREWLDKMPFPSAEVADGRAARAWRLYHELAEIGDEDAVDEQRLVALTQEARAFLIRKGVFPASRPELPGQLREAGEPGLADRLEAALRERAGAFRH